MIMIMNKIILKESVGNNNNQLYPANDLAIVVFTCVFRNCYYFLMKIIQLFISHYSIEKFIKCNIYFIIKYNTSIQRRL